MESPKKAVYSFLKKFKITSPSLENLKAAISRLGYCIVEYSHILNDEDTEALLDALGLKEFSKSVPCFTYCDANYKIIFIKERLAEDEQLILLAHELGHIYLGHLTDGETCLSVSKENDANIFAQCLLSSSFLRETWLTIFINKSKTVIIGTILITMILSFFIIFSAYYKGEDKFCITTSGDRYHLPTCETVENHKVIFGTKREFKKLGKTPCGVCLK